MPNALEASALGNRTLKYNFKFYNNASFNR
jgi:hypothetical protein